MKKPFADDFSVKMYNEEKFSTFLNERFIKSSWKRKHTKDIRIIPIKDIHLKVKSNALEYADTLKDTIDHTQLMLRIKDDAIPIRDCAIRSILDRAKISGTALKKVDKNVFAKILNHCFKVSEGEALLKIADGKVSAVHSGGNSDYSILEIPDLFNRVTNYIYSNYNCVFKGGYYDHSMVIAEWALNDESLVKHYKDMLEKHGYPDMQVTAALRFSTSDVGVASASLYPALYIGNGEETLELGSPLKLKHKGNNTIKDFDNILSMIYSTYEVALEGLTNLLNIDIYHPKICLLSVCKALGLGKNISYDTADLFESQQGTKPCNAHDLYYALNEMVFFMSCNGTNGARLLQLEEIIARALKINWQDFDKSSFSW